MNNTVRRVRWAGLLLIAWPSVASAQSAPLWNQLAPGPHAVGFKTTWQLDYSRRYDTTFDDKTSYATGKAPRPILVNYWYPAKKSDAARMPHLAYLDIRSDDPRLSKFAVKLAEYELSVIAKEVMEKPAAKLTDREKELLNEFLDTPTACVRDAQPAEGSFPLVIYHSGAGSSFEDNTVLCEFLASRGFVVLGSAFQDQSGKSFNTDNREGSARDLDFLIGYARQLPNVDWKHIGLVGHSAGAQAALTFRCRLNSVVDAVISLDTTQDYRGVNDPFWTFTPQVLKNGSHIDCPLLMVAGPTAFFELADTLKNAERYYLTIKDLSHNDYITQGNVHNERLYQLHLGDPKQSADDRAKEKIALDRAREGYQVLCEYILRFLEAELKGDAAAKVFLAKQYRDTQVGDNHPHVDYMPRYRTSPDEYKEDSMVPPTPRQVRPFLRDYGSPKTVALLRRFRKDAATHPIFTENFELFLVTDLLDQGKTEDAIAFSNYFRESGLDCGRILLQIGKSYQDSGQNKWAAGFYKRLLLLEPSNKEAAARFKEVGEGKEIGPSR
jgi:hypothetical protein